jgi:photosystem II stability/assembly factor-like uncharacterized protein
LRAVFAAAVAGQANPGSANLGRVWAVGANGTILTSLAVQAGSPQGPAHATSRDTAPGTEATRDGGAPWSKQGSGVTASLLGVFFQNDTTGWVVGGNGTILTTTDAGATWSKRDSGVQANLRAATFTSPSTGWVVGNGGTILATTDGGATWLRRDSGSEEDLHGLYFSDPTHGWAVGTNGTILATADGGATWSRRDSSTPFDLYALRFTDPVHGWAMGGHGTLLLTSDGGATWRQRDTGSTAALLSLTAAGPSRLWATGGDGSLLSITAPDTGPLALARDPVALRAALRAIGIGDEKVAQPLADFAAADTDLMERGAQAEREREAMVAPAVAARAPASAPAPVQVQASIQPPAGVVERPESGDRILAMAHDPMVLTSINRAAISVYVLLAALILAGLIRRATRLASHLDACADALVLNGSAGNAEYIALARTLSLTGRIPRDLTARGDG